MMVRLKGEALVCLFQWWWPFDGSETRVFSEGTIELFAMLQEQGKLPMHGAEDNKRRKAKSNGIWVLPDREKARRRVKVVTGESSMKAESCIGNGGIGGLEVASADAKRGRLTPFA
ncbi:hypothetical protein LINGRAHAP2_LOCUS33168 [Linum grandiflorum]